MWKCKNILKLARIFSGVLSLSYIAPCHKVIKGNCIDCMYADVFWDLKLYVFEALALSVQLGGGGLAPPPPHKYQKTGYAILPIPTEVITFFVLCCLLVSLFRRKMRTLSRWGFFFLARGGGGGQNFSAPYENPRPPPPSAPLLKKS